MKIAKDEALVVFLFLLILISLSFVTSESSFYKKKTTGSMRPFIVENTIIEYEKIDEILKVGDVAVYKKEKKRIMHRVVFVIEIKNNTFYIFKGDNNLYPDQYLVSHKNITKKVIGVRYEV